MADIFKSLKQLSSELEENLNHLEYEVSDATKLLYDSETKSKTDSKGIKILQDVLELHKSINEELEKLLQSEEADLKILQEEVDTFTEIVNDAEKEHAKLEQILIEKNLIMPEQSSAHESRGAEPALISSPPPPAPDDTFLIPPPKLEYNTHSPDSVNNDFQNTISEY